MRLAAVRPSAVSLAAGVLLVSAWSAGTGAQEERAAAPTVAADAFLAALDPAQTKLVVKAADDPARLDWHFVPMDARKGLALNAMTDPQRAAARRLLASLLSAVGYERATDVMRLEAVLAELEGNPVRRDPLKYSFTLFGRPGPAGTRWGASVEGHHLSVNVLLDGDAVAAATPLFFGSNPARVPKPIADVPADTRVLAGAEDAAFALLDSLTVAQLSEAHVEADPPREIRGPGDGTWTPEAVGPADGLRGVKMTPPQRETLASLVLWHLAALPEGERAAKLAGYRAGGGPRSLRFAWLGATEPGVGHGYRVRGPNLLIEFVNSQPDSLGNPANHAHAILRNPDGDFGVAKAAMLGGRGLP